MIPHLDELLSMNREGNMPIEQIVSYVVKSIARQGDKADFDALPPSLREAVYQAMEWYKREGAWFEVSSNGVENYAPYADSFLKKVGQP